MNKIFSPILLSLTFIAFTFQAFAQRSSGHSGIHTNSVTNPAHTVTFNCSNPATYHTDTDGSFQCGYTNQASVPTGGPPTSSGGTGYSGTAVNYDCYYYATNPTASSFYNQSTDTRTVPTNCQTYTPGNGAPINSALVLLIVAGFAVGGVMIYRIEKAKKQSV